MKKLKKVFCSVVEINGDISFEELLTNKKFKKIIPHNEKEIELSHITVSDDFITGLFVSTQKSDLAPIHTPGDDEDYSAVALKNGQGFAYPNVILYSKKHKVLLWEVNRSGVLESTMKYYFDVVCELNNLEDIKVELYPLMYPDAYERVKNLVSVNEIEFQIANPRTFLRSQIKKKGTIGDIAKLSEGLNASKSIKVIIKAEDVQKDRIEKRGILDILNFINSAPLSPGRLKNNIIVRGLKQDGDIAVEETINYMTDRMNDKFQLEKLKIAPHLQIKDRKEGIVAAYKNLYNDIKALV